jgi:hypothetical protein
MYLDGPDIDLVLQRIDRDDELAWLVPNGTAGSWRAQREHPEQLLRRHLLWHIPSGPLPLLPTDRLDRTPVAELPRVDPWEGWSERRAGANPTVPYFGAGWPGTYALSLRSRDLDGSAEVGISAFEWIGNRYAPIGRAADPSTERHWRALRSWVRNNAIRVERTGSIDPASAPSPRADIYAFPAAVRVFQKGALRARNPAR